MQTLLEYCKVCDLYRFIQKNYYIIDNNSQYIVIYYII